VVIQEEDEDSKDQADSNEQEFLPRCTLSGGGAGHDRQAEPNCPESATLLRMSVKAVVEKK
jgi:hypothetical protein